MRRQHDSHTASVLQACITRLGEECLFNTAAHPTGGLGGGGFDCRLQGAKGTVQLREEAAIPQPDFRLHTERDPAHGGSLEADRQVGFAASGRTAHQTPGGCHRGGPQMGGGGALPAWEGIRWAPGQHFGRRDFRTGGSRPTPCRPEGVWRGLSGPGTSRLGCQRGAARRGGSLWGGDLGEEGPWARKWADWDFGAGGWAGGGARLPSDSGAGFGVGLAPAMPLPPYRDRRLSYLDAKKGQPTSSHALD